MNALIDVKIKIRKVQKYENFSCRANIQLQNVHFTPFGFIHKGGNVFETTFVGHDNQLHCTKERNNKFPTYFIPLNINKVLLCQIKKVVFSLSQCKRIDIFIQMYARIFLNIFWHSL